MKQTSFQFLHKRDDFWFLEGYPHQIEFCRALEARGEPGYYMCGLAELIPSPQELVDQLASSTKYIGGILRRLFVCMFHVVGTQNQSFPTGPSTPSLTANKSLV